MIVGWHERGKRRLLYAHGAFYENYQSGSFKNRFRDQVFPVISGLCDDILAGYWTTCKPDRIRLKTEFSAREEKVAGQWMAKISRILVPSRTTDVGALISVPLGRKLESSKNQRYAAMGDLR